MKIQVLFGSQNDERVFGPLCRSLEENNSVKMEVASAHRHPVRVREIMTTSDADLFVAGAGLAAHLPGVVASMTKKPVVGIAVNGAFGGLDAFLAIVQMPKEIPVMAVTENNIAALSPWMKKISSWNQPGLFLNWNKKNQEHPLLKKTLEQMTESRGAEVTWVEVTDPRCRGQILLAGDTEVCLGLGLWLIEKENLSQPEKALDFFKKAQEGGFWVGANNWMNFLLQIEKLEAVL